MAKVLSTNIMFGNVYRRLSWSVRTLLLASLTLVSATGVTAHEIPGDVTVQAIVKPDGRRLHLLIRVPLRAIRDIELPLRGPGYLDITQAEPQLRDAAMLWVGEPLRLYEDGSRLRGSLVAVRASIPSNRSFVSYEQALAHIDGPALPETTSLFWEQAMLDAHFEYPIKSEVSDFSIDPGLERLALRVVTVLRFLPHGGAVRAYEYTGHPGLVRLDPRWHQAALRFVALGFAHILDGIDHLLFLACLVIPFRRFRSLVAIITAFTVAHSITLITSAYGLAPNALWFPPLVETLIALSIVYMAFENIVGAELKRRWLITFAFGLIHGFGFSFALRQTLQFAGSHMTTSLLSFNIGVELGQILVVALLIPALQLLFRFVVKERLGTILLSAVVAHTGWHWMTERAGILGQYSIGWPALDITLLATSMRWLILILLVTGIAALALRLLRRQPGLDGGTALEMDE